jgi:hypothetical protein
MHYYSCVFLKKILDDSIFQDSELNHTCLNYYQVYVAKM